MDLQCKVSLHRKVGVNKRGACICTCVVGWAGGGPDAHCLCEAQRASPPIKAMYMRLASYRIMRLNGLMSNAKWWDEAAVGVGL